MATEKLIVELDARTSKLDSKLDRTEKQLDSLDNKVKKSDVSFSKFAKGAVVASTAVATAVTSIAIAAGNLAKELQVASSRSNSTVEEMQAMAFAAKTVGISLEKLGDIGKDTLEKLGEFTATGGGGFKDFVDVMKLSSIEADNLARELSTLSGPQVLQEMVNRMEAAGISANMMSFALEGMASDTTDLIPLLKNGGEEAKRLSDEFFDIGETLTQADVDKLKQMSEEFDKLGGSISQSGAKLAANFSNEIITAIALVATLTDFAGSAITIIGQGFENIGSVLGAALFDAVNGTETLPATIANLALESKSKLFEAIGEDNSILKMLIGDPDEALERWRQAQQAIEDGTKKVVGTVTTGKKEEVKWAQLGDKQKLDIQSNYIKAASVLGNTFLEDNKALNAGIIVAETAAGVMKAISTSSNIYEGFANAAVVVSMGIAQLASLSSASKGGGSISSSSGSGGSSQQPQAQSNFTPETSSLEVSETTPESRTQRLVISLEDGTDLIDGIASALNENSRQGR